MIKIRTRFAPSPTGMLHIGGIRTALYNYLLAKKYNGDFILRIEDTDQTRFVPEAQEYIINTLKWLNIMPNEGVINGGKYGPYIQSKRKDIYKKYAQILVDNGNAYYAFDSSEELENMHQRLKDLNVSSPQYNSKTRAIMKNSLSLSNEEVKKFLKEGKYVIRFKTKENEEIRFYDTVRGWIKVNSNTLDDKILLKSDGMATYHLANVVDDYLMKISHVIRGEEWLPSTPLHVLMYKAFGWENEMPTFVHLPLLLKPHGEGKLSKRDADDATFPIYPISWFDNKNKKEILGFREKGFLPEAIINALSLLGWNPGDNTEIMSRSELIEKFSLEKLCKSGARFNYKKFEWFNHNYLIKQKNLSIFVSQELDKKKINYDKEKIKKVIDLIKDRCNFSLDVWEKSKPFFIQPKEYINDKLDIDQIKKSLKWIKSFIEIIKNKKWDFNFLHQTCKEHLIKNNLELKDVMPTFRLILFGELNGPDVIKSICILEEKETLDRIKNFSTTGKNKLDY